MGEELWGGRRGTGKGGLAGRSLTGLLTVKRENFPGMREFGGEGTVRREIQMGAREEVGPGRGMLRRGCPTLLPAQHTLEALLSCG